MATSVLETTKEAPLEVFEELESEVRSYIRNFPTVFGKAKGYRIWDEEGREYIDFFAGAGTLNYGHNNTRIKEKVVSYLMNDGVIHSLDMATGAKKHFLEQFEEIILKPRNLNYKIMFPGPTGTNSVESALKIARKVTGRQNILCFTNAFHGMTLGSLAMTGNGTKRGGAGISLGNSVFMPYDGYFGNEVDTIAYMEKMLDDSGSGVDQPAAVIFETVQGEGGVNPASFEWMARLEKMCRERGILIIVDDIQMGCGRTGTFFSFERAGIRPDIVCLSKSIGGYGLPLALTLIKPELDQWSPGEHNGTFRGNNLGFVGAEAALSYWKDDAFTRDIDHKGGILRDRLENIADSSPVLKASVRGRGLIQALDFEEPGTAEEVCAEAFKRGLIMETAGVNSQVAKAMPPLVIDEKGLQEGLDILEESVREVAKRQR